MQVSERLEDRESAPVANEGQISFRGGLPGFASRESWRILASEDIAPLLVLSSADGGAEVRLLVLDPRIAFGGYEELVSRSGLMSRVDLESLEGALLLTIVSISPEGKAYANLKAPIVINTNSMTGVQLILDDASLSLRAEIPTETR